MSSFSLLEEKSILFIIIFILLFILSAIKKYYKMRQAIVISKAPSVKDEIQKVAAAEKIAYKVAALKKIKEQDSDFNEETFLKLAEQGFYTIQNAWGRQDIDAIKPYVSLAVYTQFATKISQQQNEDLLNHIENLKIINSEIDGADTDKWFDTIHIKFKAQASDYQTCKKDGKIVKGSKQPTLFIEYFTFIRRKGIKTKETKSLWDGVCPSCNAELIVTENCKCQNCDCIVNSGDYDWVLSEITQNSVWNPKSRKESIKGLKEISNIDSTFIPQLVEDFASNIFWKEIHARRINSIALIKRYVHPEFLKEIKDYWLTYEGNLIYEDVDLGNVDLERVAYSDGWLYAYVRIIFSAKQIVLTNSGEKIPLEGGVSLPESKIYILTKKIDVNMQSNNSLASLNCPYCGIPEPVSEKDICDYCGKEFTSSPNWWLLKDIISPLELLALPADDKKSLLKETAVDIQISDKEIKDFINLAGPQSIVAGLIYIAGADGVVDAAESEYIMEWVKKVNIPEEDVKKWLQNAANLTKSPKISVPSNPYEAALWARALIRIGLCDGEISKKERFALRQFCGRLNIRLTDLDRLIENEKRIYITEHETINDSC